MAVAPANVQKNAGLIESLRMGTRAEDLFKEAAARAGARILLTASSDQDRIEHWDYLVQFPDYPKARKVDVKAMKSLERGSAPQDEWVCLELHGTAAASQGWLFGGHSDMIAFQSSVGFTLVHRRKLVQLLPPLVVREFVPRSSLALYKIYSRKGYEEVTWVRFADLFRLGVAFKSLLLVDGLD